ncbi:acyltransferase family protein [Accumulibacter sp.]|uniref:acyltransferase family protein n=1 Tax=Accumulibacter sp. TaxID=2053492 RepID=UPI0035B45E39
MLTVVVAAMLVDFRLRIVLALGIALLLAVGRRQGFLGRWPESRGLAFLGGISYSIFLVHFPVLLLVNAAYAQFETASPASVVFGLIFALTASLGIAALFYRWIESPPASQRIAAACGALAGDLLAGLRRSLTLAQRLAGAVFRRA